MKPCVHRDHTTDHAHHDHHHTHDDPTQPTDYEGWVASQRQSKDEYF